jgi:hypothetical protein
MAYYPQQMWPTFTKSDVVLSRKSSCFAEQNLYLQVQSRILRQVDCCMIYFSLSRTANERIIWDSQYFCFVSKQKLKKRIFYILTFAFYSYVLSCVGDCVWLIRRVLDWIIGFIDTVYQTLWTTGNYSTISYLYNLQFTVTQALGLLVFTSRILATDLQQYHCNFKSHMKSSFHSLISFLLLFRNCQLNSIPLLPSSYPGRLASRNSTQFFSTVLFFITTLHVPRSKQPLYCWEGVFIATLHNNGSCSIVTCVFLLPRECVYRVVA